MKWSNPCKSMLGFVAGAAYVGLHRRHYVGGLRVAIAAPSVDVASALQRIENALTLIETVDAEVRQRIRAYVKHIVVWPGPYSAANRWGGIHLSAEYIMVARQSRLAGTIVHEMTHLRIQRGGITYHPSLRRRIEQRCIREEASFLRKIPHSGDELAQEAEAELHSEWWTDQAHNGAVDEAVDKGELPRWAAWLVRRR